VVTAAEILSRRCFRRGAHAQAFPSFGSERTGAPVVSYCRIDDVPIRTREPVMEPDAVIVQDVTLIHQVDLFSGLIERGYVLINTSTLISELGFDDHFRCLRQDRLSPARDRRSLRATSDEPVPGTSALLGRLCRLPPARSLWTPFVKPS